MYMDTDLRKRDEIERFIDDNFRPRVEDNGDNVTIVYEGKVGGNIRLQRLISQLICLPLSGEPALPDPVLPGERRRVGPDFLMLL